MNFQMALECMREDGARVRRAGWRLEWVCEAVGHPALPTASFWNPHTAALAQRNGGFAKVLPYYILGNDEGTVQMGWTPSQADMLADDWMVML